MSKLNLKKVPAVAIFALMLGAPLAANAAPSGHDAAYSRQHVSYSDLNLERAEGIAVLYGRLQDASEAVCGVAATDTKFDLRQARAIRECVEAVLTRSVAKVGNAKLTAFHNS